MHEPTEQELKRIWSERAAAEKAELLTDEAQSAARITGLDCRFLPAVNGEHGRGCQLGRKGDKYTYSYTTRSGHTYTASDTRFHLIAFGSTWFAAVEHWKSIQPKTLKEAA